MPDWTNAEYYSFTEDFTREQWAWEFLRRNALYREEYARFMATWNALEAEYGKPPSRDFPRWKEDPRAYVIVAGDSGSLDCRVDGDKVLIECHFGARWGFHKFPVDPAEDDAVGRELLNWRTQSSESALLDEDDCVEYLGRGGRYVAVGFDLSLPLREQIERVKRELQIRQRSAVKSGRVQLQSVKANAPRWTRLLRLLDALDAGEQSEDILGLLFDGDDRTFEQEKRYAAHLVDGGYLELLLIPNG